MKSFGLELIDILIKIGENIEGMAKNIGYKVAVLQKLSRTYQLKFQRLKMSIQLQNIIYKLRVKDLYL